MTRIWTDDDTFLEKALHRLIMLLGMLVRSISRRTSTAIAHLLGDGVYSILKLRRGMVEENLTLTFPEKTPAEITALARQVYRNQAENIIEVLRLPMIKTAQDARELLELDAREFLAKTLECKRGGLLVSAHFGNWELMALCAGLLLAPVTIVVKEIKNHAINHQINAWRTMRGNRIIYDWQSLREGLRTLRNGGILSVLGDQSDPSGSFFSDFLGRRSSIFVGPAYFALHAQVPLFVAVCHRGTGGRYRVDLEEIDMTGLTTSKSDVEELTRRYTKVLERAIYQYPEEWFWLHNRWKRTADPTID